MSKDIEPNRLGALQAAELIRNGSLSSEELVRACLAHIDEREEEIRAWTHLDGDLVLEQARRADREMKAGRAAGALHGIPVGVKDIFDTSDMPTQYGTELHEGRTTKEDATAVARLRAAGAVIMGKTVTTEMAVFSPGKTRNPHDTGRTPGGSSSGSAAAVADAMVPLAIGTQTNGSIIRPASFCGVLGYKPSHGLVSRHRVLPQSRLLDHVGVFSRSTEDAALLAEQLIGHDGNDPDTRPRARFRLLEAARQAPPADPRLAFVRTPVWNEGEADARAAIDDLVRSLGDDIEEHALPAVFDNAIEWHRLVFEADLARSYRREYEQGRDKLSTVLREMIERGQRVAAVDYKAAREGRDTLRAELDNAFERFDALVTPAVKGQAPKGLDSTGSPVFCTLWTLCGAPAISLPLMRGEDGMPIGVQLVGRPGEDERLMTMAAWLMKRVGG